MIERKDTDDFLSEVANCEPHPNGPFVRLDDSYDVVALPLVDTSTEGLFARVSMLRLLQICGDNGWEMLREADVFLIEKTWGHVEPSPLVFTSADTLKMKSFGDAKEEDVRIWRHLNMDMFDSKHPINVAKDWVWSDDLPPNVAENLGFFYGPGHSAELQTPGRRHDRMHFDYSQLARVKRPRV